MAFGEDDIDWLGRIERTWSAILEVIRHAADRIGRKQVAHDLKISTAVLDNLLADRGRHTLKGKLLSYFVWRDQRVMEAYGAIHGYKVERIAPPSVEEQLAALKASLRSAGPAGEALARAAGVEL